MPTREQRLRMRRFLRPAPEPVVSPEPDIGALRKYLALGARGIGALAGLTPVTGAIGGATGELAGELIEGQAPDLRRILGEAAVGAVGGKYVKGLAALAGKPIRAAVQGAILGGASPFLRSGIERGELPDPNEVLLGATLSGGLGYGLTRFLSPAAKAAPTAEYIVEPTMQIGGRTLSGLKGKAGRQLVPVTAPAPIPSAMPSVTRPIATEAEALGRVPYVGTPAEASGRVQKVMLREEAAAAKATKEAEKLAEQQEAARRITETREGRVAGKPAISETISAPIPGGRERMSVRYTTPKKKKGIGEEVQDLRETGFSQKATDVVRQEALQPAPTAIEVTAPTPQTVTTAVEVAAPKEATPPLTQLFKTRTGAAGKNYRLAKEAARGEIPTAEYAREANLREIARKKAAGEVAVSATAPNLAQEIAELEQLKARGGPDWIARLAQLKRGETGGVDPRLLARLGLGAVGAAVGGATDPLGNPLLSAAAGGALGLAAPSVPEAIRHLRAAGAPPEAITSLAESPQTPEAIKETAKTIFSKLPQIVRFNYLADSFGLPANMWFGPYGSLLMSSIEKGLSGDPRGWALLNDIKDPTRFIREFFGSAEEAKRLVGRAEGTALSEAATLPEQVLAMPGTLMTAGDLAARKILLRHGFTEEEARRITLTAEPELPFARTIAEFGKRSPLAQMLLPFRRTPANILEQGAMRTPILGSIVQGLRETPDPLRIQALQQALGLGAGGAAYLAGEALPEEEAKILRRYVSNIAGQYSLPASIGFVAGEAARQGRPVIPAAIRETAGALPLPTTQPITELAQFIQAPTTAPIPRAAYPGMFRQFGKYYGKFVEPTYTPPPTPRLGRRTRRGRSQ